MSAPRPLPARDRPGKRAWLGPISLCLGLASWPIPAGGIVVALGAVVCAAVAIATRGEYRIDWTAVAGICAGAAQIMVSLMLLAMSAGGY